MPDMTPWSYPNKNTPRETNILVKYLDKGRISVWRGGRAFAQGPGSNNVQQGLACQAMDGTGSASHDGADTTIT